MKNPLKNSQGMALVVIIFVGAILLTLTGASLLFSSLDLKATSAMKGGTIAFQVADTGIHHALAVIPPGTTFNYSTDPNNPTCVLPSSSVSGVSATLRLPRLSSSKGGLRGTGRPSTEANSPRNGSPSGGSILMTWAPQSHRMAAAEGPATHSPISTPLTPSTGPGI